MNDVDLLRHLIAFDSISRNSNLPMAEFICEYVEARGIRIRRNQSPDGLKTNLVLSAGPENNPGRTGLVLSGHMDVVPANEDGWRTDPFTLTEVNGSYVGRGACDMKGFLALALNRLRELEPDRIRHPLVVLFTYDEEVGTLGAKRLVETWPTETTLPRSAIIGEPTSLRAIRLHKGHIEMRVTLSGTGAHSGYPHLGINAIEPMGTVISALTMLRRRLESEGGPHSEHFPEAPFVALNVARIGGGTAVNIVPDRCILEMGIRLLPEMSSEAAIARVRTTVHNASMDTPFVFDVLSDSPPLLLSADAPIYRAICSEIQQHQTMSASYATDAGWLQSLDLDCAIFGPGSIEVAHKPNERLSAREFARGGELLERLIYRFCIADPGSPPRRPASRP